MWNSLMFTVLLRGTRHVKCYSYHACTSVIISGGGRNATVQNPKPYISYLTQNRLLLNTCMNTKMQFTINSFRQFFPYKIFNLTFPWFVVKSLTFPWQLSNSLTFPGFPDKWSPCKHCTKWLWEKSVKQNAWLRCFPTEGVILVG